MLSVDVDGSAVLVVLVGAGDVDVVGAIDVDDVGAAVEVDVGARVVVVVVVVVHVPHVTWHIVYTKSHSQNVAAKSEI